MPEEKLQQYHPVLPGKVLYICRCVPSKRSHAKALMHGTQEGGLNSLSLSVTFVDY